MDYTFWKVINENTIEIPEIQRDYAHGRATERAKAIRKKFISDLIEVTKNEGSVHLDFIFGQSIDRNHIALFEKSKESLKQMAQVLEKFSEGNAIAFTYELDEKPKRNSNNHTLIPIDGQQRLTTLFLFHLYIGAQIKDDIKETLKKFQYKTRKSTTNFIEKLTDNINLLKQEDKSRVISLSQKIRNQSWYFRFWDKDPTVSGMLVVLDEIHKQCGILYAVDFEKQWCNLTVNDSIKFDFFDLKEEGLEDDLYVKMNARGKALTDFENFKAWLVKRFKKKSEIMPQKWQTNLDKEWLDLFWAERISIEKVDEQYLAFFNNMALFRKLETAERTDKKINASVKELIVRLSSPDFIPTGFYETHEIHSVNSINFVFWLLDFLKDKEDRKQFNEIIGEVWTDTFYKPNVDNEKKFTSALIKNFRSLNLFHKTFIYSVLIFIRKMEKEFSEYEDEEKNALKEWLRVTRNIIYNSRIDDDFSYVSAIQSINKFNKESDVSNIRNLLKEKPINDDKWIDFFNEGQRKEEIVKAKMDFNWQNKLIEAENHHYFYGQIGFLIELAMINDQPDLDKFDEYYEKLNNLFTTAHLDSKEFIIQRAFFSITEIHASWMKSLSSNRWSFYSSLRSNSRQRDENWRYLFDNNGSKRLETLKRILDSSDGTTDSLNKIIEKGRDDISDWPIYFICEPKLFDYCRQSLLNLSNSGKHIRLLGSSRLSHYHRELRTYSLYLWLKNKYSEIKIQHIKVKSSKEKSHLRYENDIHSYCIIFDHIDNIFKCKIENNNNKENSYNEINDKLPIYNEINEFQKIETHD